MARIRSIKPEFWTDFRMAQELTRDQRLFYIGLWNEADDEGRFLAHPRRLLGAILPYERDITEAFIEDSLSTLADTGRVVLYVVDGEPYGELVKFKDHQRINRPSASKIPCPPKDSSHSMSPHGAVSESITEPSPPEQGTGSREGGAGSRDNEQPVSNETGADEPPEDGATDENNPESERQKRFWAEWMPKVRTAWGGKRPPRDAADAYMAKHGRPLTDRNECDIGWRMAKSMDDDRFDGTELALHFADVAIERHAGEPFTFLYLYARSGREGYNEILAEAQKRCPTKDDDRMATPNALEQARRFIDAAKARQEGRAA